MDTRCNYLWSYMFILTSATINTTSFNNIPIFRFCYPNDSINVVYKKYGMKYWQVICGWPLETVRESPPTKCWRQNIQYVTLNVKMTPASPQIVGVLLTHSKHSSINRWAFLKNLECCFSTFTSLFNTMTKKHPIQRYLEYRHTIQDYVRIPVW